MALGSICEFPGNHENISTFQNAIVAPHYLILCLLPVINCQCIPLSRGCALPEQQRCAVSPCRAGQPGCCTFAACPATNKVKGVPFLYLSLHHLGVAVVASEEGESLGVASQLHLAQLLPCPIRVKVGGSGEGKFIIRSIQ